LFMGMVEYHSGDVATARQLLERAVALEHVALPPLTHDLHALARAYLALALLQQGYPEQARMRLQQAASRAAARESPFERGFAAQVACIFSLTVRDMDALATSAEQAVGFDDFPAIVAVGRVSGGRVLSARGDHRGGIAMMREGIEAYRATGQRPALPMLLGMLAEGHAAAGDVAAALACVADAQAATESCGEIRCRLELYRLEGALYAAADDPRAAERCMRRAATTARQLDERWWELRATTDLARLALRLGASAATRRSRRNDLERVLTTIDGGADLADVQDARQVLAALRQ